MSRYFYANIDPGKCVSAEEQKTLVMRADTYGHDTALWACHRCFCMLPITAFSDRMRKVKHGNHGRSLTNNGKRACVECAVKHRLYDHLIPVKKAKVMYYLCHQCRRFQTKSKRCTQELITGENSVVAQVTVRSVVGDLEVGHKTLAPLEALPRKVINRLARYLSYGDAKSLAQVSHHIMDISQPAASVPLHERFRFVRNRWREATRGIQGTGNNGLYPVLACYNCFRVKRKEKFSVK